jgi:hypothetical protein
LAATLPQRLARNRTCGRNKIAPGHIRHCERTRIIFAALSIPDVQSKDSKTISHSSYSSNERPALAGPATLTDILYQSLEY